MSIEFHHFVVTALMWNKHHATTSTSIAESPVTDADAALQMAYVAQQRLDGYAEALAHALRRKTAFDTAIR